MQLRHDARAEHAEWLRMRRALRPGHPPDGVVDDAAAWLARADAAVIVAARPDGGLAGFAAVGARPYADGRATSPAAFLEAWHVEPDARRVRVGAALVRAAEAWGARTHGLTGLASDAPLENTTSHRAHEAAGFAEVERAVRYGKALS